MSLILTSNSKFLQIKFRITAIIFTWTKHKMFIKMSIKWIILQDLQTFQASLLIIQIFLEIQENGECEMGIKKKTIFE